MRLPARFLLIVLVAFAVRPGWAQTFPDTSKPLKIIVTFGAGSSTDTLARAFARGISEVSGMKVFVENKPGAEGQIGMSAGKSALPDGYTLVMTTSSTQVLNPHMISKLSYDPVIDFVPIAGVAKFALIMNAGPTVNHKSAREFIEAAKANPGKYSFGSGTATTRLAAELLQHMAGISMLSVPYKSQTEAITGLAGGQVDIVFMDLPGSSGLHKQGRVRPLAVTGSARIAPLPAVPTLAEQGLAGYEVTGWWAAYFPAKTPPEIVSTMRDIVQRAAKTQTVENALAQFGLEPMNAVGDDLTAMQRRDSEKWGKLIRATNLAPQ